MRTFSCFILLIINYKIYFCEMSTVWNSIYLRHCLRNPKAIDEQSDGGST